MLKEWQKSVDLLIKSCYFVSMSVLAKFHDMMNMSTDFCNLFRKLYLENILYDIDISYLAVDSRGDFLRSVPFVTV